MATINKPYEFSPNTTASASEVNDNFDTIYNEFNGSISAANLASNAVTTAKITDSNVTTAKIADSNVTTAKIADSNVTTAKIADANVTSEKLSPTVGFYATTTQSMPDNASTTVTTYTEVADYGADFASGTFTAPIAGLYHFDSSMGVANITSATDGRFEVEIQVNGTTVSHGFADGDATNADPAQSVSVTIPLVANDAVTVLVRNFTGGAENLISSFFAGFLVGKV